MGASSSVLHTNPRTSLALIAERKRLASAPGTHGGCQQGESHNVMGVPCYIELTFRDWKPHPGIRGLRLEVLSPRGWSGSSWPSRLPTPSRCSSALGSRPGPSPSSSSGSPAASPLRRSPSVRRNASRCCPPRCLGRGLLAGAGPARAPTPPAIAAPLRPADPSPDPRTAHYSHGNRSTEVAYHMARRSYLSRDVPLPQPRRSKTGGRQPREYH